MVMSNVLAAVKHFTQLYCISISEIIIRTAVSIDRNRLCTRDSVFVERTHFLFFGIFIHFD